MRHLLRALALMLALWPALCLAQTITLGETAILSTVDGGNAGMELAQGPYTLSQAATINSLSFYVSQVAGSLRLGIYESSPVSLAFWIRLNAVLPSGSTPQSSPSR
jgi:hypothetical protein